MPRGDRARSTEARLLPAVLRARRPRAARLWAGVPSGSVLAAMRAVAAARRLDPPLSCAADPPCARRLLRRARRDAGGPAVRQGRADAEPRGAVLGGLARGVIRGEGVHYRLVPPAEMASGRMVTVLSFPTLPAGPGGKSARQRLFGRDALAVVRALADFNSDHRRCRAGFPPARDCGPVPVPGPRRGGTGARGRRAEAARRSSPTARAVEAGLEQRRGTRSRRAPLPRAHGPRARQRRARRSAGDPARLRPRRRSPRSGADLHTVLRCARPRSRAAGPRRWPKPTSTVFRAKGQASIAAGRCAGDLEGALRGALPRPALFSARSDLGDLRRRRWRCPRELVDGGAPSRRADALSSGGGRYLYSGATRPRRMPAHVRDPSHPAAHHRLRPGRLHRGGLRRAGDARRRS